VSNMEEVEVPNYPSNSNKSKTELAPAKKKVRPIADATPKRTAKNIMSDIFNDSIPEARSRIWNEQIKPGLLDMGANAMYTLIDYIFYAGDRRGRRSGRRSDRIDYRRESHSKSKSGREDDYGDPDRPVRRKWNQVVVTGSNLKEARDKAAEVWELLEDHIAEQDYVTVGDLFSAVNWSTVYTDFDWGWKTLDGCRYVNDGDGFWFDMTKPVKIEG